MRVTILLVKKNQCYSNLLLCWTQSSFLWANLTVRLSWYEMQMHTLLFISSIACKYASSILAYIHPHIPVYPCTRFLKGLLESSYYISNAGHFIKWLLISRYFYIKRGLGLCFNKTPFYENGKKKHLKCLYSNLNSPNLISTIQSEHWFFSFILQL